MGLRLDSDVVWMATENEKMKLTDDGFCNNCGEFHNDCFCVAFWVRRSHECYEGMVKANRNNIELCGKHDDMRKERNVWADRYLLLKDGMQKISAGHWSRGEYAHFANEQLKRSEEIK